jgi:hypothetical protein
MQYSLLPQLESTYLLLVKKINYSDFKTGKYLISNDTIFDNATLLYKTSTTQQQVTFKKDTLFTNVT